MLPLPPELPLPELPLSPPPWSSPPEVVAGVLVVGVPVVVPVEGLGVVAFFVVVFFFVGCDALLAGRVVAAGLLAGASRTPEPTGVGARPMESREIALAARPTATARQSPTDGEERGLRGSRHGDTVVAAGSSPARAPARRWRGSAVRRGCRRRRGR